MQIGLECVDMRKTWGLRTFRQAHAYSNIFIFCLQQRNIENFADSFKIDVLNQSFSY